MTNVEQKQGKNILLFLIIGTIFIVGILSALAWYMTAQQTIKELEGQLKNTLLEHNFTTIKANFDGLDVTLYGNVPTKKDKYKVLVLTRSIEGIGDIKPVINIKPSDEISIDKKIIHTKADSIEMILTRKKNDNQKQQTSQNIGNFSLLGNDNAWLIKGEIDSKASEKEIVSLIKRVFSGKLHNKLEVESGLQKPKWIKPLKNSLSAFKKLEGSTEFSINNNLLTIMGDVRHVKTRQNVLIAIRDNFGDLLPVQNAIHLLTFKNQYYTPVKKHFLERMALDNITFEKNEEGRQQLTKEAKKFLKGVAFRLMQSSSTVMEIAVHTDKKAGITEATNKRISQAQASLIKNYLSTKGIPREQLRAKGYGSTRPIASNKYAIGRDQNQRVEFHILRINYSK